MAKNFKVFAKQAGIKPADVNNYLMEQAVVQVTTTADLDTVLVKAGVRVAYCTANSTFYYWSGTSWRAQLTSQNVNAGMGFVANTYTQTDFQGASTTAVIAAGTYFVPIRFDAPTEISNLWIYCATYVGGVTQTLHSQLYTSEYGKPKTPIGNDTAGIAVGAVGYVAAGFGGPDYIVKPGLYFIAMGFTGTLRTHTYAVVTQSATSGGLPYMGWTTAGDVAALATKPRPGFFTATQYGTTGVPWVTSPAVATVATAPIVRVQVNTLTVPVVSESGLYA